MAVFVSLSAGFEIKICNFLSIFSYKIKERDIQTAQRGITMENKKATLIKVSIRRLEPLGHMHTYESFADADRHLRGRCKALGADMFSTYSYQAVWEGEENFSVSGELVIDSSMRDDEKIVQEVINLSLANELLLYTLSPRREDLRNMVLRLQWQMERLLQDPLKKERALEIITRCEGVDEKRILSAYGMLSEMTENADLFMPLLRKVFPNAQQKLQNIKMLKNRSTWYINKAVMDFQRLATDVIACALNNEEEQFEENWKKLVNFCVMVSEEQKYADERLTFIGKKLYLLGDSDLRLIKDEAFGQIKPFSEESSSEYFARNNKIKRAYYSNGDNELTSCGNSSQEGVASDECVYLKLYADEYRKKKSRISSRLVMSIHTAKSLLHDGKISKEQLKSMIGRYDPMAVQFESYPDHVLDYIDNNI